MTHTTDDLPSVAGEVFDALFDPHAQVSPRAQQVKIIYEDVFSKTLENPALTDAQLVAYLREQYGRSARQAWRDVAAIKAVQGNVARAQRAWHEYTALEMIKQTFALAREKQDVQGMAAAANAYTRAARLDKPEVAQVDWSEIVPVAFEPTADVTLLGLQKIEDPDAVKARLARRFNVSLPSRPDDNARAAAQATQPGKRGRPPRPPSPDTDATA